jgi:hypothetical protein
VDKEQSASVTAVAICAWLAAVLIVWPICRFPPVMACSSEKNTSPGWLKP